MLTIQEVINKINKSKKAPFFSNLPQRKIGILSSFVISPLLLYLEHEILKLKVKPSFYLGDYNVIHQEMLDGKSKLYKFNPDILIIALRAQEIFPDIYYNFTSLKKSKIKEIKNEFIQYIRSIFESFRKKSDTPIIINSFELPSYPVDGVIGSQRLNGQINTIRQFNKTFLGICREYKNIFVLDFSQLIYRYGYENFFDAKMTFLAKMPISGKYLHILAKEYMRFVKPLLQRNKKCLILDGDNTLWNGILGEVGFDRIQLGPDYPGSAFVNFQKEILNLYHRGILLMLVSKNNQSDVNRLFREHPFMILKKKHFASIKVNWESKAKNIQDISKEINLSLDNFVFIDDDPYEVEEVKALCPGVKIILMPKNPVELDNLFHKLSDFETISETKEDKMRTKFYLTESKREKLKKRCKTLEDFYFSLGLKLDIKEADDFSIPRIAQLTQRTNQFNLTTRRHSELEINNLVKNNTCKVYYLRLIDKFGDNGIVSVAIIHCGPKTWHIDTFLMSCRVINRGIEVAFLQFIIDRAKRIQVDTVEAVYIPTAKNAVTRDFYKTQNFQLKDKADNKTTWSLPLKNYQPSIPKWIEIIA